MDATERTALSSSAMIFAPLGFMIAGNRPIIIALPVFFQHDMYSTTLMGMAIRFFRYNLKYGTRSFTDSGVIESKGFFLEDFRRGSV